LNFRHGFGSLAGADPADPDLLTLRANALSERAGLIDHDYFPGTRLLSYCPQAALLGVDRSGVASPRPSAQAFCSVAGDPSTWTTRAAAVQDVPALAGVHLAAWLAAYRGICSDSYLDKLTRETFEGYHRSRFDSAGQPDPAQPFIVACDSDAGVIAFARGGPTRPAGPTGDALPAGFAQSYSCELYAIYVHPHQQGHGAGRILFSEMARRFHALGYSSLCLWVLAGNTNARQFYERLGGRLAGDSVITLDGIAYPQVAYAWEKLPHAPQRIHAGDRG